MTLPSLAMAAVDNWRDLLLALLAYIAMEVRRDVRWTRDKVLILWRAHMERSTITPPVGTFPPSIDPLQREFYQ